MRIGCGQTRRAGADHQILDRSSQKTAPLDYPRPLKVFAHGSSPT